MPNATPQVQFRLPPATAERLRQEAARRGLKVGECARNMVLAALDAPTQQDLLTALLELKQGVFNISRLAIQSTTALDQAQALARQGATAAQLETLRNALARGIRAVLIECGNLEPNEAEAWVNERMLS